MIKRLVSLGCGAVLMVSSLFITGGEDKAVFGRAGGKSAEITTPKDVVALMSSWSENSQGGYLTGKEYTSATVKAYGYQAMNIETTGYSSDEWKNMRSIVEAEGTYVYTPTETYIHVNGKIIYTSEGDSSSIILDAEIYAKDAVRDLTMIKYNAFEWMTTTSSKTSCWSFDSSVLGQWVDMGPSSYGVGSSLYQVDFSSTIMEMSNLTTNLFKNCGEAITKAERMGSLESSGDRYELKGSALEELCASCNSYLRYAKDYTKKGVVDLSKKSKPSISLSYKADFDIKKDRQQDYGYSYEGTLANINLEEKNEFTFENINNTAIKVDFSQVNRISMMEFAEKILMITDGD